MNLKFSDAGYAVVRCSDCVVVAKLHAFPDCERAVMYRDADMLTIAPLMPDEIVGTPTLFAQMLERAGFRVSRPENFSCIDD